MSSNVGSYDEIVEAIGHIEKQLIGSEQLFLNSAQMDNRLNHQRRTAIVAKNIAYLEKLDRLLQEPGNKCSCGKEHKEVRFKEGSVTITSMCPEEWYRKMVRLAFERGQTISVFQRTLPLKAFMRKYKL